MLRSQKRVNLSVNLGGLKLSNPVILASGTFAEPLERFVDLNKLGGIVFKTITLKPLKGNAPPRIHEVTAGILNSIGLENEGIEEFLREILPYYNRFKCKKIASIAGSCVDEYCQLIKKLNHAKLDAVELNVSCPNIAHGLDFGTDPERLKRLVFKVKSISTHPVIVKLTPNVTDIVKMASCAISAGADIISLVNTLKAAAINHDQKRIFLGGLSGPALKPVALRMVWEICNKFAGFPVIGIGGINSVEDLMDFLYAGAKAVQIGTANLVQPDITMKILKELPFLLDKEGVKDISSIKTLPV
jgi:dihydroorotate dehydrogenase (NAD+) catalytic subunit